MYTRQKLIVVSYPLRLYHSRFKVHEEAYLIVQDRNIGRLKSRKQKEVMSKLTIPFQNQTWRNLLGTIVLLIDDLVH